MKRTAAVVLIGVLVGLSFELGYPKSLAEWLVKPGGSPPVITGSYASEKLSHGDIWRIYLEANDPDGDMLRFVCVFDQVGYGPYSSAYVPIKKRNRTELMGYLHFHSSAGAGLRMPEWTQLRLTVYIRDKGGNNSDKVAFPLVLSRGARQESPPAPFDSGPLERLGAIPVRLVNPQEDDDGERLFFRDLFD
jgi:hypothetical protein